MEMEMEVRAMRIGWKAPSEMNEGAARGVEMKRKVVGARRVGGRGGAGSELQRSPVALDHSASAPA